MNDFTKKAISALTEADTAICTILTDFCRQYKTEDFSEVNVMYDMAANLRVLKSQYTDTASPVIKQGNLTVHNDLAMIEIDDVQLIGNIQFEIFMEDKWIKGHRMNSSMGQAFISKEGSWILYDGIEGRVSLPLVIDNSMTADNTCSPTENNCSPANNACSPAGNNCSPANNACSPAGNNCSPANNTCSPAGNNCSPANNACSPVGNNCSPANNACSPVGNNCSPANNACSPVGNNCSPANNACSPAGNNCSPANNACSPTRNNCSPTNNACSPTDNWMVF